MDKNDKSIYDISNFAINGKSKNYISAKKLCSTTSPVAAP
jgi:hypothetical protein